MKKNKRVGSGATNPSRRRFLKGMGLVGAGSGIVSHLVLDVAEAEAAPSDQKPSASARRVDLVVNGKKRSVDVEPRTTLLSALRDRVDPGITGPKSVCDQGSCGACTVLLDDKPVYSCLVLAVDATARRITTVEGLGSPQNPSPVQTAFVEADGQMCGFCTPGFVVTMSALFKKVPAPSPAQVREACRGNLCRCGTYPKILDAALPRGSSARG